MVCGAANSWVSTFFRLGLGFFVDAESGRGYCLLTTTEDDMTDINRAANALSIRETAGLDRAFDASDASHVAQLKAWARFYGALPACGRCGGSGKHSRCAMYGDRCFGCAGTGVATPAHTTSRAWGSVANLAEDLADSGVISEYLALRSAKSAIFSELRSKVNDPAYADAIGAYSAAHKRIQSVNTLSAQIKIYRDYING